MFALDSLVFDLIYPATARPTGQQMMDGLGGKDVLDSRDIVNVDVDLPELETQVSPTVGLRRRGEARVYIVDRGGPLRARPRHDPIIARDLRKDRDRLAAVVDKTGARLGRMGAFGSWGDAVIVTRSLKDLRAALLLGWLFDETLDDSGRRVAGMSQKEFELKLQTYGKRLEELDDMTILGRIAPANVDKLGTLGNELYVVSVLSDLDGSWDVRKSYELEKRVAALDLFSRIPGARQTIAPEAEEAPKQEAAPPAPAPAAAPAAPKGPPITTVTVGGRLVLRIPAERFDLDAVTALGKHKLDLLGPSDQVGGKERDRIHQEGCGFLAPLAFLSEVFLDGKPLDKKRFEAEATVVNGGAAKAIEAHLPRFGAVLVIDAGAGKRWVTSETKADAAEILKLTD